MSHSNTSLGAPLAPLLTAVEVNAMQFTSVRIMKPGYDETEVDEFLDDIELTLDFYQTQRDRIVNLLLTYKGDNLDLQRELMQIMGLQPQRIAPIDMRSLNRGPSSTQI